MARELSAVLDHVAKIGELDLDGVAPTSHVVEVDRRAAPRRAAPVAAARGRARQAPDGRRRAASSCPARRHERRVIQASELRPRGRARRSRAGERSDARRAVRGLSRARGRAGGDVERRAELLHVGRRGRPAARRRRPARRRAAGGQGPVLHRGRAEPVGLADPRGLPAAVHGDRRSQRLTDAGAPLLARPTRTSSRWAPRTRTPPSGRCATRGTASACRAAPRAAAPRRSRPGSRRGRSAPTPAARSASRPRCAGSSASSRPTARSRATG